MPDRLRQLLFLSTSGTPPTKLMEELGYADGYKYAHDYPGHFADLEFMPEGLSGTRLYDPADNKKEAELSARLSALWPKYYKK